MPSAPAVRPRLPEVMPALVLVLASLVGMLAALVARGSTAALDRAVLLGLRVPGDATDPLGPAWVEEAMRDVTALGGHAVLTLVTLAVAFYLLMAGKRGAALLVVVALCYGLALLTGRRHLLPARLTPSGGPPRRPPTVAEGHGTAPARSRPGHDGCPPATNRHRSGHDPVTPAVRGNRSP